MVETVPAFASLLITYDPLVTEYDTIADAVKKLADADGADAAAGEGRLVTIPVCYGGDFGPDLPFVAQHAGLTEEEVIALHAGREYQIYMLGFLPGFPYLGGLDERLFTPRLGTPRTAIPAGAVGIGGEQTGIYPIASPGGWQLIGRTPLKQMCIRDSSRRNPTKKVRKSLSVSAAHRRFMTAAPGWGCIFLRGNSSSGPSANTASAVS